MGCMNCVDYNIYTRRAALGLRASNVSCRITAHASCSAGALCHNSSLQLVQRLFLGMLCAINYLAASALNVGRQSILFHTHAMSWSATRTQAETTSKLLIGYVCIYYISTIKKSTASDQKFLR